MRILLHIYQRASRARQTITYLAAISCFVPAVAGNGTGDSPLAGWTRLELTGRKFLFARGETVLRRWQDPALVAAESSLRIPGRRRQHVAFAEPAAEGGPGRWLEISPGRRARRYAWDACRASLAVASWSWAGEPGPGWRPVGSERVAVEPVPPGLVDPWTLLVRLDELAAGSDAEVRVLTRHGARTFALRREPPRRERWSLERIGAGARRERLWLTTVRVAVEPADGGETLLGLSGPTMLTIDRGSGALLAIEGRRDGVPGTIRLALRRWGATVEPRPAVPWDVFRDPVPAGTEPAGAAVDGPRSLP